MRVKKHLALTLAAILATTMLTGCPWDIEGDTASDSSSAPSGSSRPGDDEDDDPVMYTVTASVTGETGGTVSVTPASVAAGGSVTVTITPADNYQLASVTDNGDNVTASVTSNTYYTLSNVTANHTITVTFKPAIDPDDPATWETVDNGTGKTIIVPEGAQLNSTLANTIFTNVKDVTGVDLSQSGITNIPESFFQNQPRLASITVPDGTTVGPMAFLGCHMLQTVNGTLTSVGANAFKDCQKLTSIAVNGEVGKDAFQGCSNLQNLWLGENFSIREGPNPFSGAFSSVSTLHVHYSGSERNIIESIFESLNKEVDYHWDCNGSDRGTPTTALNSGLASLLLGL